MQTNFLLTVTCCGHALLHSSVGVVNQASYSGGVVVLQEFAPWVWSCLNYHQVLLDYSHSLIHTCSFHSAVMIRINTHFFLILAESKFTFLQWLEFMVSL